MPRLLRNGPTPHQARSEFLASDGLKDEEEDAEERGAITQAGRQQFARRLGRERRLADDRDLETSPGERVGHRVQRPVPEGQEHGLPIEGVVPVYGEVTK
jgi:hypothetical protein